VAASAQTETPSTKTSLTPSSSGRQNTSTTSQKATSQPSSAKTQQPATTSRSASNSTTTPRASQTQPAANTTTSRQSLNSQNAGTTTAKGTAATAKKTEAKPVNPVKIKWMTLEEALEKSKTEKRKIFVDVYTDWCGWCKRMDTTTFVSPAVAQYLNDHYYPVKFNAEQQKDIVFKDKTYQFKKNGARGYHELAVQWLNNRLTYPTVVFLDENQSTIQPLAGYQDAEKMEAVLNYFGTDSHKKTPWETYEKNFKSQKE
jgi:thioredoxin-related protein